MLAIRQSYDEDDEEGDGAQRVPPSVNSHSPGASFMLGMGNISLGAAAHAAAAGDAPIPPTLTHTNSQIDRELLAYEEEEEEEVNDDDAEMPDFVKCPKYDECLRGKGHRSRCTMIDPDDKHKKTFCDLVYRKKEMEETMQSEEAKQPEGPKQRMSRAAAAQKSAAPKAAAPKAAAPKAADPKAGKKRKAESDPFAAALAEQEKTDKAADAAERAAKKAKADAEAKVVAAAKQKKDDLRRAATIKKREAAKMRLQAEKAARELEAEAAEEERMADAFSQQYG